ncbi:uncharacterized protein LOC133832435 [Humulus lupulus]|uniref:uncharacterized protein LOC133832435 n=1 Tax=Humulus lupulus TaxID=3486 RepID=UPI002B416DA1|nr:uncharacterized protein LOC133832435 [Humulus lupulus]
MDKVGLVDLGCEGQKFIWHKRLLTGTTGPAMKRARMDRALASIDWRLMFPRTVAKNLPVGVSDHCPIVLDTTGGMKSRGSSFKYEVMWASDPISFWVVKSDWDRHLHSNPMVNFHRKLRIVKGDLKQWSKEQFLEVKKQADEAKEKIEKAEREEPLNVLKNEIARSSLNEALKREELFWGQR